MTRESGGGRQHAGSTGTSREAAKERSPRRKPWAKSRKVTKPRRGERNLSHTSGNILLHLIFSTQARRPLITQQFRANLFAYLGGIVREIDATALIINGTNDHVHMLLRVRPIHSAAKVARVVKTNSSRWVREKFDPKFAWQTGYAVFSVSESTAPAVAKYIAGQEQHHKKHSFEEEYLAFLHKNHVEFDQRYVWD